MKKLILFICLTISACGDKKNSESDSVVDSLSTPPSQSTTSDSLYRCLERNHYVEELKVLNKVLVALESFDHQENLAVAMMSYSEKIPFNCQ